MKYLFLISILFIVEALLKQATIKLRTEKLINYKLFCKQEFYRTTIFTLVLIFSFSLMLIDTHAYFLIPAAIVSRRIFYNYFTILLTRQPKNIYSENDLFQKIFTKKGRLLELLITVIVFILCIIIHLIKI